MVREIFVRTSTLKDNTGKVSDIVKVSVSNVIKKNWFFRKIRSFYQKSEKLEIEWHVVQAMKCTGWNIFSNLKSTSSSTKIGQFFLVSLFRCRLGIYILLKYHSVHQKFFSLHAVVEAMFFELNRSRFSIWLCRHEYGLCGLLLQYTYTKRHSANRCSQSSSANCWQWRWLLS